MSKSRSEYNRTQQAQLHVASHRRGAQRHNKAQKGVPINRVVYVWIYCIPTSRAQKNDTSKAITPEAAVGPVPWQGCQPKI